MRQTDRQAGGQAESGQQPLQSGQTPHVKMCFSEARNMINLKKTHFKLDVRLFHCLRVAFDHF